MSIKLDKKLVRDYVNNPNQTMLSLAVKHGYVGAQSAARHITKYFTLSKEQRIQVLK
jgi:hypothetical protein